MNLFYVHWDDGEARSHAAELTAAGHAVKTHSTAGERVQLGARLPDALVVSLDRLPSHGRQVAAWFHEAKKRQGIPLVFVGGTEERAAAAREQFPDAVHCARESLADTLRRLGGG